MTVQSPSYIYGLSDQERAPSSVSQALKQVNDTFSQDMDGIMTATSTYVGGYTNLVKAAREARYHDLVSDLIKTNYGIQRLDADLGRATITYKGCNDGDFFMRYTTNSSTKAEPIVTHPFFADGDDIPEDQEEFGEDDDAYGHRFGDEIITEPEGSAQALYESTGAGRVFKHFPKNADFDLRGIQQYLDFSFSLKVIMVSYAEKNFKHEVTKNPENGGWLYSVGTIADPPIDAVDLEIINQRNNAGGEAPKYSWLVTGVNHEVIGSAWRQEIDFTLSGYKGWNRLIYPAYEQSTSDNVETTRYDSSNLS